MIVIETGCRVGTVSIDRGVGHKDFHRFQVEANFTSVRIVVGGSDQVREESVG